MTFLSEGKDFNTVYDRLIRYKIFKKILPKNIARRKFCACVLLTALNTHVTNLLIQWESP